MAHAIGGHEEVPQGTDGRAVDAGCRKGSRRGPRERGLLAGAPPGGTNTPPGGSRKAPRASDGSGRPPVGGAEKLPRKTAVRSTGRWTGRRPRPVYVRSGTKHTRVVDRVGTHHPQSV